MKKSDKNFLELNKNSSVQKRPQSTSVKIRNTIAPIVKPKSKPSISKKTEEVKIENGKHEEEKKVAPKKTTITQKKIEKKPQTAREKTKIG